ncbi:MAG: GWxTD domain-containing protein [Bacteroidia bacterium]
MRKRNYFWIVFLFFTLADGAVAGNLTAFLLHSTFCTPQGNPYIETYLSVAGNNVVFVKNSNGKYQGKIAVELVFTQGDSVKAFKKYNLLSPEINDSTSPKPAFIDQQRISLPNGKYDFKISIADENTKNKPFSVRQPITIDYPPQKIIFSDIEMLESVHPTITPNILSKSGYDLLPYVSNFFPEDMDTLRFYSEIYNTQKVLGEHQRYLVMYYIESNENNTQLAEFHAFEKKETSDVGIVLSEFPIKNLSSGNYNLVMELKDVTGKTITLKKIFFQRQSSLQTYNLKDVAAIDLNGSFASHITNMDTLVDNLRSLWPISTYGERSFAQDQIKSKNMKLMQQFFLNFWISRNAKNPETAWDDYNKQVQAVNKEFNTGSRKGYATDRGRVYLEYGSPNVRDIENTEPNSYPYEIWQYNKLKDQTNRKFVFYNPYLAGNEYVLLHSDARGETYDANWELDLHNRDNPTHDLDQETTPDEYGGHALDNFNTPH